MVFYPLHALPVRPLSRVNTRLAPQARAMAAAALVLAQRTVSRFWRRKTRLGFTPGVTRGLAPPEAGDGSLREHHESRVNPSSLLGASLAFDTTLAFGAVAGSERVEERD